MTVSLRGGDLHGGGGGHGHGDGDAERGPGADGHPGDPRPNQGGATSADYSGVPASVTFDAGDTSKTFTFTAAQDTVDDDGESVKLAFGTLPGRGDRGGPERDHGQHHRRRRPAGDGVVRRGDLYTAAEGGTATVTVTLSADPERTVEVPITTTNQGGATSADYSGVPASVTFDAGDTSKTFDFAATQDTEDDDGESVKLAFGRACRRGERGLSQRDHGEHHGRRRPGR